MGIEEILTKGRERIIEIARMHGAHNVRVFGSFARGDARADSDLDLLVDVADKHSAFFPGGLIADLEEFLGRKVDVAEEEGLHLLIRERVLKESIPL
jgi:uncharacterized protein